MCSSTTTTRGVVASVLLGEEPPAPQRDLHRAEVVAGDDALIDIDELLAGRRRPSLDRDRPPRHHLTERQRRDAAGGGHAGQLRQPHPQLAIGLGHRCDVGVLPPGHRQLEREHVVGAEAGRNALQLREAANQQARRR